MVLYSVWKRCFLTLLASVSLAYYIDPFKIYITGYYFTIYIAAFVPVMKHYHKDFSVCGSEAALSLQQHHHPCVPIL
jgi:hypothetical protein